MSANGPEDPLLGSWVFVIDPELKSAYKMEFRADGTVVVSFGSEKPLTKGYQRKSGADWLADAPQSAAEEDPFYLELKKPGAEMISIADSGSGEPTGRGAMLLLLSPSDRVLYNPLEGYWCRPGEEDRIRQISGLGSREDRRKERERRIREWRSEKDISSKCEIRWQVSLHGGILEEALVVRQMENGPAEIAALSSDDFIFFDTDGTELRRTPLVDVSSHLVVGRHRGEPVFAAFDVWGHTMQGFDSTGHSLWRIRVGERGIDWVAPVPIDAANTAFFIGYNGGGGVEMVGADGKSLWKAPVETNVWNVAGAKLKPTLPGFAISVGPESAIAFDHVGRQVQTYGDAHVRAVGAGDLNLDGLDEVFTLGIPLESGSMVTAFTADGIELWSKQAGGIEDEFLSDPFLIGSFGGQRLLAIVSSVAIKFLDGEGNLVGDYVNRDTILAVAKLPQAHGSDLLLVRTEKKLLCLDLRRP
jgi:hypothetical protein